MKIRIASVAIAALLIAAPQLSAQARFERLFYYVDREDAYNSLVHNIREISVIAHSA